ncbi:MAG: hypothetical protein OEY14_10295, partial [Myxococcales bacterium]|nr:hypothetical protein [Myxococcales bacterium]
VGRGPRRRLEIRPGRAQGWDANSYPFRDEPAGDGIGAPQLPWAGRPARYELREGVLSPR